MDLTNRKTVKALEKNAKVRSRQDGLVLRNLMSNMAGRQFLYTKLAAAHIFVTTFSPNALIMAFNEGERNRGLDLLNDIMAYCPEQYVVMMREANGRESATERSLSEDGDGGTEGADNGVDGAAGDDGDESAPTVSDIYADFAREQARRDEAERN